MADAGTEQVESRSEICNRWRLGRSSAFARIEGVESAASLTCSSTVSSKGAFRACLWGWVICCMAQNLFRSMVQRQEPNSRSGSRVYQTVRSHGAVLFQLLKGVRATSLSRRSLAITQSSRAGSSLTFLHAGIT